jgi:hypothetical protein
MGKAALSYETSDCCSKDVPIGTIDTIVMFGQEVRPPEMEDESFLVTGGCHRDATADTIGNIGAIVEGSGEEEQQQQRTTDAIDDSIGKATLSYVTSDRCSRDAAAATDY